MARSVSAFAMFIFAVFAVAGCATEDELASVEQESHSWGNYHWARTSNPFRLQVGDNVSSAWDGYLNTTVRDWSRSTVLDLAKVGGQAGGRRCNATEGRVEVCNGTYGNNGWLGIASISITGGNHISAGTVKLNDTYFNTAAYNTSAWRNLVMCQEVGHTLGLDHQDEDFDNEPLGTCMDYSSDPGPNQHPNSHDYSQLRTIYQHLDSFTTVGAATSSRAIASDDLDAADDDWGELVDVSADGRRETYVRAGGRDTLVTYVFWVD